MNAADCPDVTFVFIVIYRVLMRCVFSCQKGNDGGEQVQTSDGPVLRFSCSSEVQVAHDIKIKKNRCINTRLEGCEG